MLHEMENMHRLVSVLLMVLEKVEPFQENRLRSLHEDAGQANENMGAGRIIPFLPARKSFTGIIFVESDWSFFM